MKTKGKEKKSKLFIDHLFPVSFFTSFLSFSLTLLSYSLFFSRLLFSSRSSSSFDGFLKKRGQLEHIILSMYPFVHKSSFFSLPSFHSFSFFSVLFTHSLYYFHPSILSSDGKFPFSERLSPHFTSSVFFQKLLIIIPKKVFLLRNRTQTFPSTWFKYD